MGSILSNPMAESMKKNQEFMINSQRAQFERQITLQNELRKQQMAVQIARSRDLFMWWATFYTVATVSSIAGFRRIKNPAVLAPIVPLTFIVGYIGDLAYGSKLTRIQVDAGNILREESHLLNLPSPLPTIDDLDRLRQEQH